MAITEDWTIYETKGSAADIIDVVRWYVRLTDPDYPDGEDGHGGDMPINPVPATASKADIVNAIKAILPWDAMLSGSSTHIRYIHKMKNAAKVDNPAVYAPTPQEARAQMRPLTARQLRLGLVRDGKTLAQVQAAIDAIPGAQAREEAQVEWDYATQFERLHPLVISISGALGYDADDIDALWGAALSY